MLGPLVLIISVIAGALATPGYSHISESICQLASRISPHPGFTIAGFVIHGLLMVGLAHELSRSLRPHKHAGILRLAFVIHGIGILLGGVLQADSMTAPVVRTPMGILHNASVFIGCLALLVGLFIFARIVYHKAAWLVFAKCSFVILPLLLVVLFI